MRSLGLVKNEGWWQVLRIGLQPPVTRGCRIPNPIGVEWRVGGGGVREYCTGFLVFPQRPFIALLVSGVPVPLPGTYCEAV